MQASHIKCITKLIVTSNRHCHASWVWSCTNFVHSTHYAPNTPSALKPMDTKHIDASLIPTNVANAICNRPFATCLWTGCNLRTRSTDQNRKSSPCAQYEC